MGRPSLVQPSCGKRALLDDFRDNASADGAVASAGREAQAYFRCDRCDQLNAERRVLVRHDYFRASSNRNLNP